WKSFPNRHYPTDISKPISRLNYHTSDNHYNDLFSLLPNVTIKQQTYSIRYFLTPAQTDITIP
ncbi:hypothetical protein, partial [Parabacteroides leei]|uniref:hypothetical protein n=1 Tax=Parabacteroides leei TaxID=2939491 RepID=UPI003241CC5B